MPRIRLRNLPANWRAEPSRKSVLKTQDPELLQAAKDAWKQLLITTDFKRNANPDWFVFEKFLEEVGLPNEPGLVIAPRPNVLVKYTKYNVTWVAKKRCR